MNFKQSRKFLILSTMMYLLSNMPVDGMNPLVMENHVLCMLEYLHLLPASSTLKLDYVPDKSLKGELKVARECQKLLTEKDLKTIVDHYINNNKYFPSQNSFHRDLRHLFRTIGVPSASIIANGRVEEALCIYNAGTYAEEHIKIGVLKPKKTVGKMIDFDIIPYDEEFIENNTKFQSAVCGVYAPSFIYFDDKESTVSPVFWLYKVMFVRKETDPSKGCFKAFKEYLKMNKLCFGCYSYEALYDRRGKSTGYANFTYYRPSCLSELDNGEYLHQGLRMEKLTKKNMYYSELHDLYNYSDSDMVEKFNVHENSTFDYSRSHIVF